MARRSHEIQKIQNNLLVLLKSKEYNDITDDVRIFLNKHTMRLTHVGYKILKKYYDCWEFENPPNKAGQLMALLQKMKFPYYTTNKRIVLFSEQDAFMCKLAGPDGWLESK